MKTLILAGGLGTRISEDSHFKPKPMIEVGERPILWHIMKIYSAQGFNDFVVCCGYKQYVIKEYFANYYLHSSDITFDFAKRNLTKVHSNTTEPWRVTLVDTGLKTMTGGRVKLVREYVGDEAFMLTYGDGVADVNLHALLNFHKSHGKTATVTIVNLRQRFGVLDVEDDGSISSFREKASQDSGVINGGFMVFEPKLFDYLSDNDVMLEHEPLEKLAEEGELMAYRHAGFWQCMDTQRDRQKLEDLWGGGEAPWKKW